MRVTKYSVELDEKQRTVLVKEDSKNVPEINRLDSPEKICNVMNQLFRAGSKAEEYVWLIAMDMKCNPIGMFEVCHGTVNASLISPREMFVRLCLCGAANFIIVHNHPSKDTTPSAEDIDVTRRMKEASELMGIRFLDHIIIGESYYSFAGNRNVL